MDKFTKKVLNTHNKVIRDELTEIFEDETIPGVKDYVIESYEGQLTGVVTDRRSQARPEDYQDEFLERLDVFEYIKEYKDGITFVTPDMGNFDFSGELTIINIILEGLVGIYYEISAEDIMKVNNNKLPIGRIVVDSTKTPKNRHYLMKSNDPITKKVEEEVGRKNLILFPFSNNPPIDIFEPAEEYVNENMKKWIDEAIKIANKKLVKFYDKGGR